MMVQPQPDVTTAQPDRAKAITQAFKSFPAFCGLLDILPKTTGRLCKFRLNRIQRLYYASRSARDVVLKARQVGQTTYHQAEDVYKFITVPGSRVVATCHSMTGSDSHKFLRMNYDIMFRSLERLGVRLVFQSRSASEWTLADRDSSLRIIDAGASEAAASKKGRSGTITRLHLTETAFYEYADETLNAMLECVPGVESGSEIVSESTPKGAVGRFYEQCRDAMSGKSGFRFHFFPWFLHEEYAVPLEPGEIIEPANDRDRWLLEKGNVRLDQLKWYQRKRREKGQTLLDQEYPSDPESCFLLSGRGFFDGAMLAKNLLEIQEPLKSFRIRETGARSAIIDNCEVPAVRIWAEAEPGRRYLLAVDTSSGELEKDRGGALVFDRASGQHMATLWGEFIPWELARHTAAVARLYAPDGELPLIVVERLNHGGTVLRALMHEVKYPERCVFVDRDGKFGWLTTETSRTAALDGLEKGHRCGHFKTYDRYLLSEMRTFQINEKGRAEARRNEHDDLVMMSAIGWDVLCRQQPYRSLGNLTAA